MRSLRSWKSIATFVVLLAVIVVLAYGTVRWMSDVARYAQSARHLKMLYVALAQYSNDNNTIVMAYSSDADGQRLQSWRVELLPYLDAKDLYAAMDTSGSWLDTANQMLLNKMPQYYRCPSEPLGTSTTNYFAVLGPGSSWSTPGHVVSWLTGDREQVLLVEVAGSTTPWIEPRDLSLDELVTLVASATRTGSVMHYITAGGDVRTVRGGADRDQLGKLLLGDQP
jgi:hypothetical protein